jgi:hypothetical protein
LVACAEIFLSKAVFFLNKPWCFGERIHKLLLADSAVLILI